MKRLLALLLVSCAPAATGPGFALVDVNPGSSRSGQTVQPADYLGAVSAWYFGHSS